MIPARLIPILATGSTRYWTVPSAPVVFLVGYHAVAGSCLVTGTDAAFVMTATAQLGDTFGMGAVIGEPWTSQVVIGSRFISGAVLGDFES